MEDVLKQIGQIMKEKNIEGLQKVVAELLPQALENLAANTSSPIDDALVAVVKKPLVDELLKLIAKI